MAITLEEAGNRFLDISGKVFGKLTAIKPVGKNKSKQYLWECICECGNTSIVSSTNLVRGNTKACGCVRLTDIADRTRTHGLSKTRIFKIWVGMRKRCINPNCKSYENYGGRGIKVCERWELFDNFYEDMKDGYADNLTLDRYPNVNGNYEKSNCRWATSKLQNNNRRSNTFIEIDGVSKTISEWSSVSNVAASTIGIRLKNRWNNVDAVFKPSIQNKLNSISKYLVF